MISIVARLAVVGAEQVDEEIAMLALGSSRESDLMRLGIKI
jgi:hypothetical protein